MKLISEKELEQLLINSEKLYRLECGGVDNWENYGYALNQDYEGNEYEFYAWEQDELPELLNNYKDVPNNI